MGHRPGGMEFTQGQPIRLPPPPEQLPATPIHVICPERPEVILGQTIRRGQHLTQPKRRSQACLVSPVTGTLKQLEPMEGRGYHLVIEPAGRSVTTSLEVGPPRGRKLENWFEAMRSVGLWGQPDGGVGLINQLEAASNRPVEALVCVGIDPFPPYPDQSSLLLSFPDDAVLGTLILADMLSASEVVMLTGRVPALMGKLRSSCREYRLRMEVSEARYPAANPTMVAYESEGLKGGPRFLPHRHNPVEQGVAMILPWTAIVIGRWFTLRRFDLLRPLFIARPGVESAISGHYALPGQPLATIDPVLGDSDARGHSTVIAGNPMTGRRIDEPAVAPSDEYLLTVQPPPSRQTPHPCINCGWCLDVCPTQLDPVRMLEAARGRDQDGWLCDQLAWCVDCGLCSHVCPSSLPLAQTFRAAGRELEGRA